MTNTNVVSIGNGRVRSSDQDLHRAACKAIWESNHIVFESLPGIIRQIIEYRTWKSYGHKDFASYALDQSSNGLGISNNQRLWILKCSMDWKGKHIKEWIDVLEKVDATIKLIPRSVLGSRQTFEGNTLETLAKNPHDCTDRITYLPSRNTHDRALIAIKHRSQSALKKLGSGKITLQEARRELGVYAESCLSKAKGMVRKMYQSDDKKELREFIKWMDEKGYKEDAKK